MVRARLSREDAKEKGWLLDGYPRSFSQAQSLEKMKIRPDIYIVLVVCDPHINFIIDYSMSDIVTLSSCGIFEIDINILT